MAESITLQAEPRQAGRHAVRELRLSEKVPAVVYGPDVETQEIAVNNRELRKALFRAGTGLIGLDLGGGKTIQVLAREIQHHPVKHYVQHVDFLAVSMTEALRLEVPIHLEGSAPIMARTGYVLMRTIDTVEVECMATDIPQNLVANLSKLVTEEDSLYVRDLVVPPGVKVLTEANHVIAAVTHSRTEAEAEAVSAETPAAAEVEVVAKGKKEEEA
jgi:large subunit ribosomal protein L25